VWKFVLHRRGDAPRDLRRIERANRKRRQEAASVAGIMSATAFMHVKMHPRAPARHPPFALEVLRRAGALAYY
jgi:hypothetical protein